MNISPLAIEKLTPHIIGNLKGRELVAIFQQYGFLEVYDEMGLPDIGKSNGQRPSKTEYTRKRLTDINGKPELRNLMTRFLNNNPSTTEEFNEILQPEGYNIEFIDDSYHIQGGIIVKNGDIKNDAHFLDIQNKILLELDKAQVSIRVVMAWFTNEILFNKLLEKHNEGIDVKVAIYDDGINRKHGIDIAKLPHALIRKGKRGGLMHNKFCVIDNQVAITGSYNWTDNAETRNDENITVSYDNSQATNFSVEFRRLTTT